MTKTMTEIPEVSNVERTETQATAYFENGAKLRYKERAAGIHEEVFAPSDPDSVMEDVFITSHADTPANVLADSLDMLEDYDTVEELRIDWDSLAEWITHEN